MPYFDDYLIGRVKARENPNFSSTFSTNEFLLAKEIGITPVSQVIGSAFVKLPRDHNELISLMYGTTYVILDDDRPTPKPNTVYVPTHPKRVPHHYASQSIETSWSRSITEPIVGDVWDLTTARLKARQIAVTRMRREAEVLGASGVIGAKLKYVIEDWDDCRTLECTVMGTAVKVPDWQEEKAFTSLLNVQQFWRLWQKGYEPCGIAIGACSYSDCAEKSVLQRTYNQEIASYSVSFNDAHELAMQAFNKDVQQLKGIGAVGIEVDFDFESFEKEIKPQRGRSSTYEHLITHFIVTGTAIRRRQSGVQSAPQRTLRILDLSHKSIKGRKP